MGKKHRHKEKPQEKEQEKSQSTERCGNCFQNITNLIALLIVLQFICKALEE